jgi:hypothetical protein
MRIALGAACALVLTMGSAYANDQSHDRYASSIRSAIGACHKLPSSERGACKAEAQQHQDAVAASRPATALPASSVFVEAGQGAINAGANRYKSLASACHHAPSSEHNSCVDEASLGLARPAQLPNAA